MTGTHINVWMRYHRKVVTLITFQRPSEMCMISSPWIKPMLCAVPFWGHFPGTQISCSLVLLVPACHTLLQTSLQNALEKFRGGYVKTILVLRWPIYTVTFIVNLFWVVECLNYTEIVRSSSLHRFEGCFLYKELTCSFFIAILIDLFLAIIRLVIAIQTLAHILLELSWRPCCSKQWKRCPWFERNIIKIGRLFP